MKGFLQNIMGKKLVRIILALFLFCFVVTSIYPLIWLVFFSFKSNEEIFGGNVVGPPKEWLIENYKDALLGGKVLGYLGNSVFVTFVVIIASTVLISMVAYAVTRMKWKLQGSHLLVFYGRIDHSGTCYFTSAIYYIEKVSYPKYTFGNHHSLYGLCSAIWDYGTWKPLCISTI